MIGWNDLTDEGKAVVYLIVILLEIGWFIWF